MKKHNGHFSYFASLYFILFVLVIIASILQIHTYLIIKDNTEDALAASNLASAVIDIEEYGINHNIVVSNPDNAYRLFQDALKINMGLDEEWNSTDHSGISGEVIIQEYIIYNVRGSNVDIYHFGNTTYFHTVAGGLGIVEAPNGQKIESTSVYSKISFTVEGIFNIRTEAVKDNLVDIVKN